MELAELLNYAKNNIASDLHLSCGHPPIFRINGDLVLLKVPPLTAEQVKSILNSIMTDKQRSDFEERLELDFAIHFNEKRYRVNAFNTMKGIACVMRVVPTEVLTLKEMHAPPVIESLTNLNKGLILVTGPTGSGKSTTVAAMIHHINQNYNRHILTIEDPVEFVHKSNKSLINQREIGMHSKSFANALKSSLREDPDVILVGELRDLETIQLAITAAETGHLVIATLHTSSAAQTIDRVIDVFSSDDKDMIRIMLSTSLEAIVSQRLVKKSDGTGRVSAFEILIATPAVRNLIRESKIAQITSLMQINSKHGMCVMKDSIFALMNEGIISQEDARLSLNITAFEENASVAGNHHDKGIF